MKLTKCKSGGNLSKGFTLIELLAVIVILAVIALIATPIILNIINDSKKSAAVDSAYGYIEAIETHLAMNELDEENYPITGISLDGDNSVSAFNNIKLKGTKPSSGTVTLSDGRVTKATLTINGYIVEYDGTIAKVQGTSSEDNASVTYQAYKTGTQDEVSVIYFNPTTGEKCSSNDAVSTTGTKSGCMKWYAIENSDETKSTVDVILDHNTNSSGDIQAVSEEDFIAAGGTAEEYEALENLNTKGMVTANKQLLNDTSDWVAGLNPRLIKAQEIVDIVGFKNCVSCTDMSTWSYNEDDYRELNFLTHSVDNPTSYSGEYAWLYDYLVQSTRYGGNYNDGYGGYGYWTDTTVDITEVVDGLSYTYNDSAWVVDTNGYLSMRGVDGEDGGIRPVITISKDLLK